MTRLAITFLVFSLVTLFSPLRAQIAFGERQSIDAPGVVTPTEAILADLDGDGDQDALASSFVSGSVLWAPNDGTGAFGAFVVVSDSVAGAASVAAGDIDGDTDIDVVSASAIDDKVAWYANDGSGEFGPQRVISVAADSASEVLLADLDDDGDLDVLVASILAGEVNWYVNDGSGGFPTFLKVATLANVKYIGVGNMDADTLLDVVATTEFGTAVYWYKNNGDGTFGMANDATGSLSGASSFFVADVNGDMSDDIVVSTFMDRRIFLFYNNGFGTFSSNIVGTLVTSPSDVFAADVDDDSDLDIVGVASDSACVYWYENGGASFLAMKEIDRGIPLQKSVFAGDIDGDADLDVIATATGINAYKFDSTDFGPPIVVSPSGAPVPRHTMTADLDADGDQDVLMSAAESMVAWYENVGGGAFSARKVITTLNKFYRQTRVADLDGDEDNDVVVATSFADKVAWYAGDGAGGFGGENPITTSADDVYSICLGDFDLDGDIDVASASQNDNKIAWYENDGAGAFGSGHILTTTATGAIDVAAYDLDADFDIDIMAASRTDNTVAWYENDGTGAFGSANVICDTIASPKTVRAADFDGDGDLDVVVAHDGADKIVLHRNAGGTTFDAPEVIDAAADGAYMINVADFDSDGDPDLIATQMSGNVLAWYENDGAGAFGAPNIVDENAAGPWAVYPSDIDGDGDFDAVAAINGENTIAWYENLAPAGVVLRSPNGGERLFVGGETTIRWASHGVGAFDVEFSTDDGATWNVVATDVPSAPGEYVWSGPERYTYRGLVRLADPAGVVDQSDERFSAVGVALLAPTGGETLQTNVPFQIQWTSFDTDSIIIDYSSDGGGSWTPVAVVPATDTAYSWTTPPDPTTQAVIRIADYEGTGSYESGLFTIFRPNSWAGSMSDDWSNGNNWGSRFVPDDLTEVYIPPTANDPVVRSPITSVFVADLTVESDASLRLEAEVDTFRTRRDVTNRGTIVAVGETEFVVGGDWINDPQNATDLGFVPGLSTVALTDSGTANGEFYNLKIDSGASVVLDGKVSVSGKLTMTKGTFTLGETDTLTIESDDSTAVEGEGVIYGGTVVRVMRSGSRAVYRFESPKTTVKFPDANEPEWYAMTTIFGDPDTLIPSGAANAAKPTELTWVVVPEAILDTAAQTFTIENAEENGVWTFGFIDSSVGKPGPDEVAAGNRFMRRTYRGSSGRNAPKEADSTSGPTYTFRWDKADMPAAADSSEDDWSELRCFTLGEPVRSDDDVVVEIPTRFVLEQNYPNPFNPATTIRYALPEAATVRLTVYNALGERAATLVNGAQEAGYHKRVFAATRFASGVYFYRLEATSATGTTYRATKKMLLVK